MIRELDKTFILETKNTSYPVVEIKYLHIITAYVNME